MQTSDFLLQTSQAFLLQASHFSLRRADQTAWLCRGEDGQLARATRGRANPRMRQTAVRCAWQPSGTHWRRFCPGERSSSPNALVKTAASDALPLRSLEEGWHATDACSFCFDVPVTAHGLRAVTARGGRRARSVHSFERASASIAQSRRRCPSTLFNLRHLRVMAWCAKLHTLKPAPLSN
jgi:hypothetical protein